MNAETGKSALKERFVDELRRYAAVSFYLFVCFSVISLYETSLSQPAAVTTLSFGVALGKALVLGKFILIGEALKAGGRVKAPTLFQRIVLRVLSMLIVLVVLKLIEELILALAQGKPVAALFAEVAQHSFISMLAPVLLMLLILIPLITAIELSRALGGPVLKELLFGVRA